MRKVHRWLAVFALASCSQPDRLFEVNTELPQRRWIVTDTLRYQFRIHDIAPAYRVSYQVRNTLEYPYSRLFVYYSLRDSAGRVVAKNLMANDLFNPKTGEPYGSSGLGDLYDHRFTLLDSLRLERNGRYYLNLVHQMRNDTLPGIAAVGIRVSVKAQQTR
jgi:gliding motility-associated lipoprotein GldH